MAGIPTRKIVGIIRQNAVAIYLAFGLFSWYSFNRKSENAFKFIYSRNEIERKNALAQVESFIESNKSGSQGKGH